MGVEFPQPADAWEGILDATSYGYVCPLLDMGKPGGELMFRIVTG